MLKKGARIHFHFLNTYNHSLDHKGYVGYQRNFENGHFHLLYVFFEQNPHKECKDVTFRDAKNQIFGLCAISYSALFYGTALNEWLSTVHWREIL